jgi:hypothetical protein
MLDISYHNKKFRVVPDGLDENADTVFHYEQNGDIVTATFEGGYIIFGNLIAVMDDMGALDMRYSYVDANYDLVTGTCHTTPTLLADGRLRLYERWQQTSGDMKKGHTILEEIDDEDEGSF